jgi:predicted metal-dependent hydrolase
MIEKMLERLARGIDFFNREYFFEAHDEIEELWMDARKKQERELFHGLVNMATGFYHYRMHNFSGMRSQLLKGFAKLYRRLKAARRIFPKSCRSSSSPPRTF